MNIKLILFPNSLILIAQIVEVVPEDIGQPDCKIIEPFEVKGDFLERDKDAIAKQKAEEESALEESFEQQEFEGAAESEKQ